MDLTKLRVITNAYQDVRVISLKDWKSASEISPRDRGGPYIIGQEGYSPEDQSFRPDEFVLSRAGKWLSVGIFFALPLEQRRAEFIFGTISEVVQLMQSLPSKALVWKALETPGSHSSEPGQDELSAAFTAGSRTALPQAP
jgi:hypothetical protein